MDKKLVKKVEIPVEDPVIPVFSPVVRMVIPVPHRELDDTIVTSQGLEKSVKSLYEDYVMGVLTAKDLGQGSYDEDDSDDVDPLNTPGLTLEEASAISDAGRNAAREVKEKSKSPVASTTPPVESETKVELTPPAE